MPIPVCLDPASLEIYEALPSIHQQEIERRSVSVVAALQYLEPTTPSNMRQVHYREQAIPVIKSMVWVDFLIAHDAQFPRLDLSLAAQIALRGKYIAKVMAEGLDGKRDHTEELLPLAVSLTGLHATILAAPELFTTHPGPLEDVATQIRTDFLPSQVPLWNLRREQRLRGLLQ